ncbi:exodeoxyribonuclease VII large subunit [Corynebacterium sp. MC-04]|uniref:Exodeoxyribonuclease 7 large subunit n=1 Tax=Corynebacterium parakroppenstedtii TaxID=2828363 RepID=A0ABS9HJ57_9CORY|nr:MULTISPECIES: exodeoxyribonuclease VII large subunit [Corynebacterium]MDU3198108.1 exodeoxyribonuclease VII large subunit [Corynebacterium kroppenstedtii]MBY0793073.1 exodeoxyribonuclease VII large subunit [Corynebacterium parakroppenstedtii]MBY0797685.1 exodeoxyribonuclease VII large subunit [Corynebacterium parakroppenstedtii]MCF6769577.1 exodeoxyribonuclease VII large subunit [Corynebacterium parakroppenstedtii]MCF6771781.1 exodeoxyribonuclease VII large subunit [Corynebacterium parakrop
MTAKQDPTTSGSRTARGGLTSPEAPWPVRILNRKIGDWISKLGSVWVEGQLTQMKQTRYWTFLTLLDVEAEMSIELIAKNHVITSLPTPLSHGDRVIVLGKPNYSVSRGQLKLSITDIRPVGIGELLARIEQLRKLLAAEGLLAPERKKPLPVLPQRIGLITGRGSAAERDVISIAQERWPAVNIRTLNPPVQGASAVPEVKEALTILDRDPTVDVIIVARGGGSVEDLLPFSDESLVRHVSTLRTPIVSAIGHETDNPVLDDVADLRAATPTDAAKRVVIDMATELEGIRDCRQRGQQALFRWLDYERNRLNDLRQRPVMADPMTPINRHAEEVARDASSIRRNITLLLERANAEIAHLRGQVSALGPSATLARGYSIVQVQRPGEESEVATSIDQTPPGSQLRIRLNDGSIVAATMSTSPAQ